METWREKGVNRDPHMDGTGLRFKTMEHGGEYPDTMPQAVKLIDAEGRSCINVPTTQLELECWAMLEE